MLGEYLGQLGRISDPDILRWLMELEDMDRRLKTTDSSPREMIQAFIVSYVPGDGKPPGHFAAAGLISETCRLRRDL
ncbi:MAG: hypothetical protein MZW92_72525 [Comamonadaceae bacterium]|nr:hypothetical protein [Comamonadaceae bacterium]